MSIERIYICQICGSKGRFISPVSMIRRFCHRCLRIQTHILKQHKIFGNCELCGIKFDLDNNHKCENSHEQNQKLMFIL